MFERQKYRLQIILNSIYELWQWFSEKGPTPSSLNILYFQTHLPTLGEDRLYHGVGGILDENILDIYEPNFKIS